MVTLQRRFFWDWTAPRPSPLPPQARSPPPSLPAPHHTLHSTPAAGAQKGRCSFGLGSLRLSGPHHPMPRPAPLSCTFCTSTSARRPSWFRGVLLPIFPRAFLWLPTKGPGWAPLALKGAQAPSF